MTPPKLIVAALCFLPLISKAQEKVAVTKIGINYSIDYTYRNLNASENYQWQSALRDNGSENATNGFHSGITFFHQFKRGLILEGGVQYARFGHTSGDAWTFSYTNEWPSGPGKNYYDYLGIPIKVGYGLQLGKRISLSATLGISTNVFLAREMKSNIDPGTGEAEKQSSRYSKEADGSIQYERMNFVSVSSIGIDIQLFNSFSVRFEPTFRYFLNSIRDSPVKERPYSAGLSTTVFYRFGNKSKASTTVVP